MSVGIPLENINPAPACPVISSSCPGGSNARVLNAEFGETTTNGFKGWSDINQLTPLFNNYCDSMQATLKKRFSDGSLIGFAYTFSKAIRLRG